MLAEAKVFNRRERRVRRENIFSKLSASSAISAVKWFSVRAKLVRRKVGPGNPIVPGELILIEEGPSISEA